MDSRNACKPTSSQQSSTDNSRRQSPEADVSSQDSDERAQERIFYLEIDDDPNRDDAAATETNLFSVSNNNNTEGGRNRDKSTDEWTAVAHSSVRDVDYPRDEEKTVDGAQTSRCDDVFTLTQTLRDDGAKTAVQNPQTESGFSGAQTPQQSWRSPSMPIPSVQRANSSPLSTVCRPSHSQVVVRCQVTSHDLPDLSSSCPAAFSPLWTRLVPPTPRKNDLRSSERKRRHTVGPATHAQQSEFQRVQQLYHHHHYSFHGAGGGGPCSPPSSFAGPGGRSLSDSELQNLLVKEVGEKLRKMSDEFHFSRTGGRLTTVKERSVSEESSDDEM